ncbi:unnamed protein product [Kuraishia capsulata CBS 1993]|uniref:Alpha-L-rhamnosidase six-hairpin glycosidase domain-containing protein n=1 Tax=Kuraishia capsulata CBS 1993 TaxID=1382522 RepID=W6MJ54_9ASCO|nr:uncharacterized protein KUCA_T00000415001 [Kuraishia capsulata CBS 1993]CDK24452.1 unnamed protein product [Kuraishia capsulata CBS 1993]
MAETSFAQSVLQATPNEGPWETYKISPASRTVYPTKVYSTEGVTEDAENLVGNTDTVTYLKGQGAAITLDFGFNTCGFFSVEFGDDSDEGQSVHLAFAESNYFIDKDNADRSMDFIIEDKTIEVPVSKGVYVCPFAQQRGAFKYMTISTRKPGKVSLKKVSTKMNNMPSLGDNLRNYKGYFYSSDDFANTIWYAGAYTVQLSIIPTDTGRRMDIVSPATGWSNDVQCGFGPEVLVDGARRDRTIWSGDRGISQLTEFLSFNSESSIDSTNWILAHQTPEGRFPYACEPINRYNSDTYHLWTLKCIHSTVYYNSGSLSWLKRVWPRYTLAIEMIWKQVDETGTLKIKGPLDWGRDVLVGHSTPCNCLLYMALADGAELAVLLGDKEHAEEYATKANSLKEAINSYLWDEEEGLFMDDDVSNIHSHDGNALSLFYKVATEEKLERISKNLTKRWTKYGALAPEMQHAISPFIGSLELMSHTLVGHPERSYELFRTMWGYIWNAPYGVKSSLIEGYNGDGTCKYPFIGYDPAYISHCHPWASGPTIWLSNQIVGVNFLGNEHKEWSFAPEGVFAENSVEFAQTGFVSKSSGYITAGWKKHTSSLVQLVIKAPVGTSGVIGVPVKSDSKIFEITLDGKTVAAGKISENGRHYLVENIDSGDHVVIAKYD